jgi:t-SNARE complex subunit (syntaxin)
MTLVRLVCDKCGYEKFVENPMSGGCDERGSLYGHHICGQTMGLLREGNECHSTDHLAEVDRLKQEVERLKKFLREATEIISDVEMDMDEEQVEFVAQVQQLLGDEK